MFSNRHLFAKNEPFFINISFPFYLAANLLAVCREKKNNSIVLCTDTNMYYCPIQGQEIDE